LNSKQVEFHFSEIAKIVGGATPSTTNDSFFQGNIPWITPKDLSVKRSKYTSHGSRNLSAEGFSSCSAKMVAQNSILMSCRAPIGLLTINTNPVSTNQGILSLELDTNLANVEYVYYKMQTMVPMIEAFSSGATFPEISRKNLGKISILLPSLKQQKLVSNHLSAIDSLVDTKSQMIDVLKSIVDSLYRSWFIDFVPVKAKVEGKQPYGMDEETAALFPDSFEDSDFGPIPKGWELKQLSDIAEIIDCSHATKPEPIDSGFGVLLHVWNIDDTGGITLHETFEVEEDEFHSWASRMVLTEGDCVVTKTGRVAAIGRIPHNLNRNLAMGRNMIGIRMEDSPGFLYAYLLSPLKEIEVIKWLNSGTVMPSLHVKYAERLSVVFPSRAILRKFEEIIEPLIRLIDDSRASCVSLESCRDALLPRLMSGEMEV
tara:strand:+ start:190 stop:1476 length:1287 start_codon:yes stop_codon:yes gene_type:complete